MSASYIIKESLSGFKRARLASFVTISTISLSLVLIGVFLLLAINAQRVVNEIRERLEVEAYLDKTITDAQVQELTVKVMSQPGVKSVQFISIDEAAKIFEREFGENVLDILETNPLPPSLKISVYAEYGQLDSLEKITKAVENSDLITEIRLNKTLIKAIDQNARILWMLTSGIGLLVGLASIFLVSNTIRLTIYAKRHLIQTMKLVGATTGFIRTPFIIEGFLQGMLGGFISAALVYGAFTAIDNRLFPITDYVVIKTNYYAVLIGMGALFGIIGSLFSVKKFISMRIYD